MEIIEELKDRTRMPYKMICEALQLPVGSFNRWRHRARENLVLIKPPGPKKVEPFDYSIINAEIRSLDHGRKRSAGTTELYRRHHFELSRRELARMVEQVRQDLVADHRRHLRRIEWITPGVVWAMDGTQYDVDLSGKLYLCNLQDLGSRYKFLPLAGGGYPVGERMAEHLSENINRYGAPLVLKRDNEGILNHAAVNEVLREFFILPLNSPKDYAPYNGAIEESQRELKECLQEKLALAMSDPLNHVAAYAESAVNDLNHRIRACLNGRTSCQVLFQAGIKPTFTRRQRREIYDSIMEKVERILSAMKVSGRPAIESAWRIAVESWLTSRGYITPRTKPKVSPNFPSFLSHE
jgi:hypothetical protein